MSEFAHVRLGQVVEHLVDFAIVPGSRHVREAPTFIERFSTGEQSHRGDAFWQHWVQAGFRGGLGQEFANDVEMGHTGIGMDGREKGKLLPFPLMVNSIAGSEARDPEEVAASYTSAATLLTLGGPIAQSFPITAGGVRSTGFTTKLKNLVAAPRALTATLYSSFENNIRQPVLSASATLPASHDGEVRFTWGQDVPGGTYYVAVEVDDGEYETVQAYVDASGGYASGSGMGRVGTYWVDPVGPEGYEMYDDGHALLPIGTTISNSGSYGEAYGALNPGQTVTFKWLGRGAKYIALKASNMGIADIQFEDSHPASADLYASADAYQQVVYDTGVVPFGWHTMTITRSGSKNAASSDTQVNIDAIRVEQVPFDFYFKSYEQAPAFHLTLGGREAFFPTTTVSMPDLGYEWAPRIFSANTDETSIDDDQVQALFVLDTIGSKSVACANPVCAQLNVLVVTPTEANCPVCGTPYVSNDAQGHMFLSGGGKASHEVFFIEDGAADDRQGATSACFFSGGLYPTGRQMVGTRGGKILAIAPVTGATRAFLANTPLAAGKAVTSLCSFGGRLYASQDNKVWSWDGKADALANWTSTPVVSSDIHFTCSAVWNGAMYWGGYQSFHSRLFRIDAAGAIEVAAFDDNFTLQSLCVYDGSLFVGGASYDVEKQRHVGRVYRYNGSTVRELDLGKGGLKRSARLMSGVWDMCVWDGMLVMPCLDYAGLIGYDAAEDAFYYLPGVSGPAEAGWDDIYSPVFNVANYRGELYVTSPRHGLFKQSVGDHHYQPYESGRYVYDTSFFEAGVTLADKMFYDVTVNLSGWRAGDAVEVYYRISPDHSFTHIGTATQDGQTFDIWHLWEGHTVSGQLARKLQLRFVFTYGPSAADVGSFSGYYVRYVVEPGVRRNWAMTLVCADRIKGLDGTMDDHTGAQLSALLWELRERRYPFVFEDVDGKRYWVVMRQASEYQRAINEAEGHESTVSVQLWEAKPHVAP